jgi:hypothetical protein
VAVANDATRRVDGDEVWLVDSFQPGRAAFIKGAKVIPLSPEAAKSVEIQLRNGPAIEEGRFYVQLEFSEGPGKGVVTKANVLFPPVLQPWRGRR